MSENYCCWWQGLASWCHKPLQVQATVVVAHVQWQGCARFSQVLAAAGWQGADVLVSKAVDDVGCWCYNLIGGGGSWISGVGCIVWTITGAFLLIN